MGKRDDFTLMTQKHMELVLVRGCGKSWEVTMPNSFGNLIDLGEGDN